MKSGWEIKKLGDVCTLQRGFDLPTHSRSSGIYPLVSSNGITDRINEFKVKGPGVVTGRSGSIGNIHFIEGDFWPLNTALYIKDFHDNYPRYIFYLLTQFDLSRFTSGAGVPTLNRNHVHDEEVFITTNFSEQKRIVAILDETFTVIDKAKANTEKNLQNAKELFESYLQSVFEKHDEKLEMKTFEEICELIGGSQPAKDDFIYEPRNGYIRLIQVRDYRTEKYITYIPKHKAKRFCSKDDIMIGRYGPPIFGIFKGLEGAYNVALMKAEINTKICNSDYFYWFLKTNKLKEFVERSSKRAAGQDGVRKELLDKYPVPVPTLSEQKEIVNKLKTLSEETKKLEIIYQQKLDDLKELKKSILQKAFV